MRSKKIDLKDSNLLIVGPLYNKTNKLSQLEQMIKSNHTVIFMGDTCFPYEKFSEVSSRLNEIKSFMENKNAHYILGDKDLLYMNKTFSTDAENHKWIISQQVAIRCMFDNQTSVLLTHGGIWPKHTTWDELTRDFEIAFISNLPEVKQPWHKGYNGRFGYVISAHPGNKSYEVQKFNHSMALDTDAYESDKVAVVEYGPNGLVEINYI